MEAARSLLETINHLLKEAKVDTKSADKSESVKQFIPDGKVDEILSRKVVETLLLDQSFRVPEHKLDFVVHIVAERGTKLLAILIELGLQSHLMGFVQADTLDNRLPRGLEDIRQHIHHDAKALEFFSLQWEYYPFRFCPINYQRNLEQHVIVPYIEQQEVGKGGYSDVFRIMIHPAQQTLQTSIRTVYMARKRIKVTSNPSSFERHDEAELLFLLGSVNKHQNVVELLGAYHQAPFLNLIFPCYEMDLHNFLLSLERPPELTEDVSILKALHGLSSGLAHLHQFFPQGSLKRQKSVAMHGCHHDIKPRNVLVGNGTFVLSDFGCADIKAFDQDSKTNWKNTTFEYGAPECRDLQTWSVGKVGRALDVWSLGCIISEVLTYSADGKQGVLDFRERRKHQQVYGTVKCFHDGFKLSKQVTHHVSTIQNRWQGPGGSIFQILWPMFSTSPSERPTAIVIEQQMGGLVLRALTESLIKRLETMFGRPSSPFSNNLKVFAIIEITRLKAWNRCVFQNPTESDANTTVHQPNVQGLDMSRITDIVENVYVKIAIIDRPVEGEEEFTQHGSFLSLMRSTNDQIWDLTPTDLQKSIGETFLILIAPVQPDPPSKQDSLNEMGSPISAHYVLEQLEGFSHGREGLRNQNLGKTSTMRRLSLLLSENKLPASGRLIKWRDVKPLKDLQSDPQLYLHEGIECLVEWQEYASPTDTNLTDDSSDLVAYTLFERMQSLAALLNHQPRPNGFRVLDCLGSVHDEENGHIGFLYKYPLKQTEAVRLHKILRHGKQQDKLPNPSEKLRLAKTLVEAIYSFHVSGWIHKDVNSFNVLFFNNKGKSIQELDMDKPFIVGFIHSRPNTPNAISVGVDLSTRQKEYFHPSYRMGSNRFQQFFEYYSLGLLLLEIGLWNPLSKIYNRKEVLTMTPMQLKLEYLKICSHELLLYMGEKYATIVVQCLNVDSWDNVTNNASTLEFKERVLDQIRKINF